METKSIIKFTLLWGILAFVLTAQSNGTDPLFEDIVDTIDFVVDTGGSGDYTTVQAAVDAAPSHSGSRTIIYIRKGVYYEKVRIGASKKNLVLIGEHVDSTIIHYDDYAGVSGFDCTTVRVDADDFLALNLTIENSYDVHDSQALALATYGDRQVFAHCKFLGWQDTYFSGSELRAYFKDCLFTGAVDYIYGPTTILFDSCQLHNIREAGGYITAASTPENAQFGYVFRNCWISGNKGVTHVDLGRPWRPHASVVWLNCYQSRCVSPAGWNNWGNTDNEETAFYAEYQCYGPGSVTDWRVDWSHQLTDEQAQAYTMANIYAASGNPAVSTDWMPSLEMDTLYRVLKSHTIPFLHPSNVNASLSGLKSDGVDVEGFHPDSALIPLELPPGSAEVTELTANSENDATTIIITYPEEVPGFATIDVTTPYRAAYASYDVYFSVDSSFHSANILGVTIKGNAIPDFDPDKTYYEFYVPDGSSKYFAIEAELEAEDASFTFERPASLPGLYTLRVTAVDGYTTKEYGIYVSFATSAESSARETKIHVGNPFGDHITGRLVAESPGEYIFRLYSLDGKQVINRSLGILPRGNHGFSLGSAGLENGSYICRISGPGISHKILLLKILPN